MTALHTLELKLQPEDEAELKTELDGSKTVPPVWTLPNESDDGEGNDLTDGSVRANSLKN